MGLAGLLLKMQSPENRSLCTALCCFFSSVLFATLKKYFISSLRHFYFVLFLCIFDFDSSCLILTSPLHYIHHSYACLGDRLSLVYSTSHYCIYLLYVHDVLFECVYVYTRRQFSKVNSLLTHVGFREQIHVVSLISNFHIYHMPDHCQQFLPLQIVPGASYSRSEKYVCSMRY